MAENDINGILSVSKDDKNSETPEDTVEVDENEESRNNFLTSVPSLTEEATVFTHVQELLNANNDTPETEWIANALQERFGDNYDIYELANDKSHAQDFLLIGLQYIREKCDNIKTKAFSLNTEDLNGCIKEINNLALLQIDANKFSRDDYNDLIRKRVKNIKILRDTYTAFCLGRQIFEQIVSGAETDASQIMVEDSVQHLEELYAVGILNKEQLALGYHNIAVLFEKEAKQKNDLRGISLQNDKVNRYMMKALSLTADVRLIKTCYECIPDNYSNKMQMVREACDRAFDEREDLSDSALFTLHLLYGKSLENVSIRERFLPSFGDSKKEALSHYKQAFIHAGTQEQQTQILRSIARLQKEIEPDKYFNTKMELISNHLSGKTRIKEFIRLAAETGKTDRKILSLESAANELVDAEHLPQKERSLLLTNIISTLRSLYSPKEIKKLAVLKRLEKEYCQQMPDENFELLRISSRGHDYFSEDR